MRDQGHAAGAGSQLGNPVSAALLSKAQYSSAVATQSLCTLSRHVVGSHWAPSRHRQFGQGLMFSLCVFRGLFSVGGCLCGVQSHCAVRQAARVLQKVDSRRNTRGSPSVARSTLSQCPPCHCRCTHAVTVRTCHCLCTYSVTACKCLFLGTSRPHFLGSLASYRLGACGVSKAVCQEAINLEQGSCAIFACFQIGSRQNRHNSHRCSRMIACYQTVPGEE